VDPRSVDIRIFDASGLGLDKRSQRKLENLFFREDIRRVVVGILDQLGVEDPLARDFRRRLATALY